MMNRAKQNWSTLNAEERAMLLAQIALGWDDMTPEQQQDNLSRLIARAASLEKVIQ